MKYLITGCAGFIGFHTARRLMTEGHTIVSIDNYNDHYDPKLKKLRADTLKKQFGRQITFYKQDIEDFKGVNKIIAKEKPDRVIHLAARAGVRDSLVNPFIYVSTNIVGTLNVFEACHRNNINNIVYASSSSVYGGNNKFPSSETDRVDQPISLYAQTKKDNELLAYFYYHNYKMNLTGLRFFTVYGPYGRPDMAAWLFADGIRNGTPITINNNGKMQRDFTYVSDIVDGIIRSSDRNQGFRILNLGNNNPTQLMDFVKIIEKNMGKEAVKVFGPLPPGDVIKSCADLRTAKKLLGWQPRVKPEEGLAEFIKWYKEYKGMK